MEHHDKFHFRDGSAVGSLEELKDKLEGISYQEFYHHVNTEKNDFASWIRHVHGNEELASNLEKVTSIVETVEILNDFINPMPAEKPHDDIQSRIEEEELDMHIPVQDVPTTEPEAEHTGEEADLEVIREKIDAAQTQEAPEEPKLGTPEHPKELAAEEQAEAPEQPEQPKSHEEDHVLSQEDYTRLIVKDFMYGLIAGLVIGVILGRILSF